MIDMLEIYLALDTFDILIPLFSMESKPIIFFTNIPIDDRIILEVLFDGHNPFLLVIIEVDILRHPIIS